MDRGNVKSDSKATGLRRSSRKQQGVFAIDLRPREALKRSRDATALNATEECSTDEGSPDKISKVQMDKGARDKNENGDQNNTVQMDVEEPDDQSQDMSSEDENENSKLPIQEERVIITLPVENLETVLQCRRPHKKSQEPELSKLTGYGDTVNRSQNFSREPYTTVSSCVKHKSQENMTNILTRCSIKGYQDKMEKARDISAADLQGRGSSTHMKDHTTHSLKTNNIPAGKQSLHHTNTDVKKTIIRKMGPCSPTRADAWGVCRWLLRAVFVLASLALGLMGYQHFPSSSRTNEHRNRLLQSATFETNLAELKALFPSQQPEFWKRTEIHLKRHLSLTDPKEPVSVILTSGREAETTLGCLAQRLATAFSHALNSTVLSIDGSSKSEHNSDDVKLEIDIALKEAFEGGTQAAVIHRLEELPPGSTLIFYRYCDHENSAFKKVFLAFTVMLPVAGLDIKLSLSEVEEQVQAYLKKRFVSSDKAVKFNQMDVDKLSGLWSRISHVILPVAAEQKIEQQGCMEKASG